MKRPRLDNNDKTLGKRTNFKNKNIVNCVEMSEIITAKNGLGK